MFEELQKQRTRNVVRKIADQFHAAMREKNARIELQRISVDDFKSLIVETRERKKFASRASFSIARTCAPFSRRNLVNAPKPGPISTHIIFRSDLRLIDNPASEILIVQKILTESFGRRDADFFKRRAYLGKLHRRGARPTRQQGKLARSVHKIL